VIILDTNVLLAYFVGDDPNHRRAAKTVEDNAGRLVVSPFVVAELDYLVMSRWGVSFELAMLEELCEGEYEFPVMGQRDLMACHGVLAGYPDQRIGVTDASLVVLADRYRTTRIATFDRRHFDVLRTMDGKPFEIVPGDGR
jgi:predicted nucleic acid-binding protein